jgi:hypothetical protein
MFSISVTEWQPAHRPPPSLTTKLYRSCCHRTGQLFGMAFENDVFSPNAVRVLPATLFGMMTPLMAMPTSKPVRLGFLAIAGLLRMVKEPVKKLFPRRGAWPCAARQETCHDTLGGKGDRGTGPSGEDRTGAWEDSVPSEAMGLIPVGYERQRIPSQLTKEERGRLLDLSPIVPSQDEKPPCGGGTTGAIGRPFPLRSEHGHRPAWPAPLGVPVWVALSAILDWRWQLGRQDSPWYPTMRLFRQQQLGDWQTVMERMAAELGG